MKIVEISNGVSVNVEMITFIEKYSGKSSTIKTLIGINHLVRGIGISNTCSVSKIIETALDYDEVIKRIIK
jgi:hypothetical protein